MTYEEILRENEALKAEVKRLKAICYAEIRDTIDEFYESSLKDDPFWNPEAARIREQERRRLQAFNLVLALFFMWGLIIASMGN